MSRVNLSGHLESLFEAWPETVMLFHRHRMACPGCYLAAFETLESALKTYNIDHEPFLENLSQIIADSQSDLGHSERTQKNDKGELHK